MKKRKKKEKKKKRKKEERPSQYWQGLNKADSAILEKRRHAMENVKRPVCLRITGETRLIRRIGASSSADLNFS
jgi:sugar-specific transcriptional regulator TrmB